MGCSKRGGKGPTDICLCRVACEGQHHQGCNGTPHVAASGWGVEEWGSGLKEVWEGGCDVVGM